MEEEVQKIWTLSKADRIQNVDYAIGVELTNLYSLMKEDASSIPDNFEDLLLALIVINKGQISLENAHLIALCCVFYYKLQKPPNYWKLIPILTEEVKKLRKPSIYILGLLSKRLCDGFKSQLPTPIQYLLKCNDESLFPLICQCFRRIIKGTGTFLIQLIPDIFEFIFAGSSSSNESIRIESVKSIPTLLEHAHISIKKLLPIVGQLLQYTSKEMRFSVSKSLAKIIFIGAKTDSNFDGKKSNENIADTIIKETLNETKENAESNLNPFKYGFKIILQFAQNDKNAETLALTMHILLRFYQPIEIVKRLRTFTNFVLCLPSLKLPLNSVLFLSNSVISAVISVVGSTIGNSFCYHITESIKNSEDEKNKRNSCENLNEQKTMIALTALINFDASTKTFAMAAKHFYPFLSYGQKSLQKACILFFRKLGEKEENLGRIFIDTFCSFLATIDNNRINDIDGFSKATASIILSVKSSSIIDVSIEKVRKVITSFLNENNFASCKMPMAYLLLASLTQRRKGYDMIPFVFNFTQSYLKTLPKRKVDKFMKKTIKYVSLYFLQIILNPPRNSEKLTMTIRYFISIILPNVGILSKSGQFVFLKLIRNWFEIYSINNEKIADFLARSISCLFQSSFEKETRQSFINNNDNNNRICRFLFKTTSLASIDYDLCNIFSADLDHSLYNFETPSNNHVSHIQIRSLIEFFNTNSNSNIELKSDDDFLLLDLSYWFSKCSQKVLNEIIPPLFEFNKLDVAQIIVKLKLITCFLKSKNDFNLTKSHFDKLLNLEQTTRIDSNTSSKPQKQKFTQIQFALAQTVSQWFITNSTFSDLKLINNSQLKLLMNNKNLIFSSLLISFTSKFLCDEIQVQSLLFLMQNIHTIDNPVLIYSLSKLISSFKLISDFSVQIGNFLEDLSYSNVLISKASMIKSFSSCVLNVYDKINYIQMIRIISNLLHFPINSNYAKLKGLQMISLIIKKISNAGETNNLVDSILLNSIYKYSNELNLTLQEPLPILISAFSSQKIFIPTIDDVPLLFMILQQSTSLKKTKDSDLNEKIINECIFDVFERDCNVKKWTNFSKRIVIIGCVPPAERKGDIRILPTMNVLICAIKIAVELVSKIRETMELRCVDDIVSIAFTAIHMEKRMIDFYCYSILSSVIKCFDDVRNQENSLLDVYFSQFHPAFCHAFDEGKRELKSVASFVISYFRYIETNRKNLIDEVSIILVKGLNQMKFDNESLVVFCRVSSLVISNEKDKLNEEYKKFNELFIKASTIFLKDVLQQKRSIVELKEESPNFISKYQSIQKDNNFESIPNRILLALLLSELRINCNSVNLDSITNSEAILNDIDSIDFVLKTIANSNLLTKESEEEERIQNAMKSNEDNSNNIFNEIINKNQSIESTKNHKTSDNFVDGSFDVFDEDEFADNEIDQSSFSVYPIKKASSINRFLLKITNGTKIVSKLFESILTLSLSSPICFGSICNLLKMNSEIINNKKYITLILSKVLNEENKDNEILGLFKFMFEYISIDVIDSIIPIIINKDKISNEKLFEILRYAFVKLNGYEFKSISDVVSHLKKSDVLLPDGINFVGSLLVSTKTALTALFILDNGLLTPITTATISSEGIRILPRILHFFNTTLNIVKKICDIEDYKSFCRVVSRVVLVSLAQVADVKEKAAVVKPACLIIKNIDENVLKEVFNAGRLRRKAIISVTPQKQAEAIQLLTFANVSNRKSNNGEWQTLEIDDED